MISPDEAHVSYQKFDEFVDRVQRAGRGVELGKFDLADAYKSVLVRPKFWHLLGLHLDQPDGARQFFANVSLPFGHRLSPAVFCKFARALNCIAQFFGADPFFNYVDDFLTAQEKGSGKCARNLGAMDQACWLTGFRGKQEKREGPTTCLSALGIEVDTVDWELRIGAQRLAMVMGKLVAWKGRSRASKREIASLHRHLSFIARVVKPGRIFLHRVVEEMESISNSDDFIELSAEFHTELDWWRQFLPEWNGICMIPEFQWTSNADFDLFMDASGSGFGGFWQGAWFSGQFTDWACKESMAFKELFAIVMALSTWGSLWQGKKIRFFCDNKAACQMLQFKNSHRPRLAALLCTLYQLSARYGCLISACHLPGVSNSIADALSRGWLHRFFELYPYASPEPTQISLCDLDFSGSSSGETRCPGKDIGSWLITTIYPEGLRSGSTIVSIDDAPVGPGPLASGQEDIGSESAAVLSVPASRVLTGGFNNPVLSVRGVARDGPSQVLMDSVGLAGGADLPPSYRTSCSCPSSEVAYNDGAVVPGVSTVVAGSSGVHSVLGGHGTGGLVPAAPWGVGPGQGGLRLSEAPFTIQSSHGFQSRPVSDGGTASPKVKDGPEGFRPDPGSYVRVFPNISSDVSGARCFRAVDTEGSSTGSTSQWPPNGRLPVWSQRQQTPLVFSSGWSGSAQGSGGVSDQMVSFSFRPQSDAVLGPFAAQGWSNIGGGGGAIGGDDPAAGRLAVRHVVALHPDARFGAGRQGGQHGAVSSAIGGCGPEEWWLRQFSGMGRGLPAFT